MPMKIIETTVSYFNIAYIACNFWFELYLSLHLGDLVISHYICIIGMFYTHTPHSVYHGIVIFHCMVFAVIFQLIFCHTFTSLWIGHILVFCSMDKVSYSQLYKGGKWFVHEVYFILSWFVWWCTGVLLFIMFISTKQRFSMISNVAWPSRCMKYWLVVHYNLETWIEWCRENEVEMFIWIMEHGWMWYAVPYP